MIYAIFIILVLEAKGSSKIELPLSMFLFTKRSFFLNLVISVVRVVKS